MKNTIAFIIFLVIATTGNAQKTFPIWPGAAPGSENWTWHTQVDSSSIPGDPLTYNIVQPVLFFFPADPALANGTSVIICPGGSFCYLHTKTEGSDVAEWLNKKGVSAFVLLYRVVHSETTHPMREKTERAKDTAKSRQLLTPVVPMQAIADGKQALLYARQHATEFGISPDKIGIIGFSWRGVHWPPPAPLTTAARTNQASSCRSIPMFLQICRRRWKATPRLFLSPPQRTMTITWSR